MTSISRGSEFLSICLTPDNPLTLKLLSFSECRMKEGFIEATVKWMCRNPFSHDGFLFVFVFFYCTRMRALGPPRAKWSEIERAPGRNHIKCFIYIISEVLLHVPGSTVVHNAASPKGNCSGSVSSHLSSSICIFMFSQKLLLHVWYGNKRSQRLLRNKSCLVFNKSKAIYQFTLTEGCVLLYSICVWSICLVSGLMNRLLGISNAHQ